MIGGERTAVVGSPTALGGHFFLTGGKEDENLSTKKRPAHAERTSDVAIPAAWACGLGHPRSMGANPQTTHALAGGITVVGRCEKGPKLESVEEAWEKGKASNGLPS